MNSLPRLLTPSQEEKARLRAGASLAEIARLRQESRLDEPSPGGLTRRLLRRTTSRRREPDRR